MRIAARNTRFAVKEVDIGLAADLGTLSRLPKLVGSTSWVKDVCLSARDFSAEEALAVGFVSQVHDSKDAAVAAGTKWAEFVASKSPVAVQGTKELLNHARDHSVAESKLVFYFLIMAMPICILQYPGIGLYFFIDFADCLALDLRYTTIWNAAMLQSSDTKTALMSGLQKKKPTFEKL